MRCALGNGSPVAVRIELEATHGRRAQEIRQRERTLLTAAPRITFRSEAILPALGSIYAVQANPLPVNLNGICVNN